MKKQVKWLVSSEVIQKMLQDQAPSEEVRAMESLQKRAFSLFPHEGDLISKEIPKLLAELYAEQRAHFAGTRRGLEKVKEWDGSGSLDNNRFFISEFWALKERSSSLRRFPQNPTFGLVINTDEEGAYTIPPEIGNFTNLTELRVYARREPGDLCALPQEMRHLKRLTKVHLTHQDFTEIPPILGELPALESLDLTGCPILRIEDAKLWRKIYGWNLWTEFVFNVFHSPFRFDHALPFGLRPTHVPFPLWFKEHCTIPYFEGIWRLEPSIEEFLEEVRSVTDWFWAGILSLLIYFTCYSVNLGINTPIFLIDLFLMKVIEPVVCFVRDALGYDKALPR